MQNSPAIASEWIIVGFIAAVALLVLVRIWKVDLSGLLAEAPAAGAAGPGKASMARLQLLLFTFVIAGLYLILCLEAGEFVDIPNQVLGLLGISSGSFVV